jgi:hypothetical protein
MITLTWKQFIAAVTSPPGTMSPIARFFTIPKSISAGSANRKLNSAVLEEWKNYSRLLEEMKKKHTGAEGAYLGGVLEFEKDYSVLLAQSIELPGVQVRYSDLLAGGLIESDYDALEPFLSE